jgi:hypothetical protein
LSDDVFAFRTLYGNKKYLSVIGYGNEGNFIQAAKDTIDEYCKFKVIIADGNKIALLPYYTVQRNEEWWFASAYWCYNRNNIALSSRTINKYVMMEVGEPLLKKEIVKIEYNLDAWNKTEVTPEVALSATVQNPGTADVTQTLSYEYTKSEQGTWNNSAGVEIGVASSFSAGIPLIGEVGVEISTTASYNHEWGGSIGKEKKITSNTQAVVPARSKGKVKVIIKKALLSIPFSYIERRTYLNGKVEESVVKTGIYQNVESYDVDVQTYDFAPI